MAGKAHTMLVARDPTSGAVLLSATVNVYNPGTVTPISATIFDKNGNTLGNPLTSDATTGLIDFYLSVAQEVDLVVSKTGYSTRTYSNVPVLDDASNELTALMTTTGDIVYASANNTPARLGIGAQGTLLNVGAAGIPRWGNTIDTGGLTITAGNVGIGTAAVSTAGLTVAANAATGGGEADGVTIAGPTGNNAINYGLKISAPTGASSHNITLYADGSSVVLGKGNMATNASQGFLYIPYVNGTPSGTPVAAANGQIPIVYDVSTGRLYFYNSAAWHYIAQTA